MNLDEEFITVEEEDSSKRAPIDAVVLEMLPHAGVVHIDDDGEGKQVLTHVTTLSRLTLPEDGSPWTLTFDEAGFAAVASPRSGKVMLVEDVFHRNVYVAKENETFVLDVPQVKRTTEMHENTPWSLRHRMRLYTTRCVRLDMAGGFGEFECFHLPWPRHGCHLFWGLSTFYKPLGLSCYQGIACKWVWETRHSFHHILMSAGIDGMDYIMRSFHNLTPEEAHKTENQFLPAHSANTLALLVLLAYWSRAVPRHGGFRDKDARHNAGRIFRGFVVGCCREPWEITLVLCREWRFRWPRPEIPGERVKLAVGTDGNVDLRPWRDAVEGVEGSDASFSGPVARHTWLAICEHVGASGFAPLHELFTQPELQGWNFSFFLHQLFYRLAVRVEYTVLKSERVKSLDWPLRSTTKSCDDGWAKHEVDNLIVRHKLAGKRASPAASVRHFGLASDKAVCRGTGLNNSIIVLPNNKSWELLPQVDL